MQTLHRGFHVCENGTKTVIIDGNQYKGEWTEGYLLKMFGELSIMKLDDENNVYPVVPQTVGLYSGLPDTAGNNICLKDVIKYRPANSDSDKFLLVKWDEERATFKAGFATLWVIHDHCEVVGNLFENPELLQQKE